MTTQQSLPACPQRPNCVSSQATDPEHAIEPIRYRGSPADAWAFLKGVLQSLPRIKVVEESGWYLRAESKSAVFGFVDDIECLLLVPEGIIHVRSASRIGYSDLGTNRKRVEQIRQVFVTNGTGQ